MQKRRTRIRTVFFTVFFCRYHLGRFHVSTAAAATCMLCMIPGTCYVRVMCVFSLRASAHCTCMPNGVWYNAGTRYYIRTYILRWKHQPRMIVSYFLVRPSVSSLSLVLSRRRYLSANCQTKFELHVLKYGSSQPSSHTIPYVSYQDHTGIIYAYLRL